MEKIRLLDLKKSETEEKNGLQNAIKTQHKINTYKSTNKNFSK